MALNATKPKRQGYEVRWFNYPQICINGEPITLKKGDIINKKASIRWAKDWQAIKVVDTKSKKWFQLLARPEGKKEEGIWDIIGRILLRVGVFSTHEGEQNPIDSLANALFDEYELLDSIIIDTNIPVSNTKYFEASYEYGDSIISKKLRVLDGSIIIDKSVFSVNGTILDSQIIPIQIDYINDSYDKSDPRRETVIKDGITFYIIPQKLEDE